MSDFTAIGQLITEARTLLDSIKGGAIRKMQSDFDALKVSFDTLITRQRARVDAVLAHFDQSTSFVHSYKSLAPISWDSEGDNGYHVVELDRIKNRASSPNPMISLAFYGGSNVGAGMFVSLAQTHLRYKEQKALIYKEGDPEVRFFVDRTNINDAPLYMAVKNTWYNNASIEISASSNAALAFKFHGIVLPADIPAEWEEIQKVNA